MATLFRLRLILLIVTSDIWRCLCRLDSKTTSWNPDFRVAAFLNCTRRFSHVCRQLCFKTSNRLAMQVTSALANCDSDSANNIIRLVIWVPRWPPWCKVVYMSNSPSCGIVDVNSSQGVVWSALFLCLYWLCRWMLCDRMIPCPRTPAACREDD
jgi:hypothetical protein